MKHIKFVALALAGAAFPLGAILGQQFVNSPRNARQVQFLWEQAQTAFLGVSSSKIDSIFATTAHREHAICLALAHRSEPLPAVWSKLGGTSLAGEVNLLTSRERIPSGENTFILPSAAIPDAWLGGEWTLIINGNESAITPDEAFTVEVSSAVQSITAGLRFTSEQDTLEHHLLLSVLGSMNCPEPDLPPWPAENPNDPFWVGIFQEGQAITGQALVRLGADQAFDKPLILLEGFDPGLNASYPNYGFGDLNWDVIWNCDGEFSSALDGLSDVLDSLLNEGFDLVFLDFEDGTQSVFDQTALVRHIIEKCRDFRVGYSPLVMVGPSMGGVVGRLTLRQMELDGMDHCTRLFIAIDSPFRGAYLPVALQEAISFFAGISVEAANLQTALSSPAAGELLVGSPLHSPSNRLALEHAQSEMGLPERCTNLSIVNSHPAAASNPPALWYSAEESFLTWEYLNIQLHSQPGDAQHPASSLEASVIFEGELLNPNWEWGASLMLDTLAFSPNNSVVYEGLAGSGSEHLLKFNQALNLAGINASYFHPTSMFVPAHSALDIPLFEGFETSNILFDDWSLEPLESGTAIHCDVTHHVDALWNHIVLGQPAENSNPSAENPTVALGWSQPFRRTLQGPENDEGTCSYIIGNQEANGVGQWPDFEGSTSTCSPELRIAPDKVMHIGDELGAGNSRAHFTISGGEALRVEGDLFIGPHSSLTLSEGSTLIIESGKIHVAPFGQLLQERNSRIESAGAGAIFLNGSTATWHASGVVHLNDGDTLTVSSEPNYEPGEISFEHQTGYAYLGEHARFELTGRPEASMQLNFAPHARSLVEGAGELKIEHASINLLDSTLWHIKSKSNLQDVHAQGITPHHLIRFENRFHWSSGVWDNLRLAGKNGGIAGSTMIDMLASESALQFDSTGLRLLNSVFNQCSVSGSHLAPHSLIQSCSFSTGMPEKPQLMIESTQPSVRFEDNAFSGHGLGLRLNRSNGQFSCNTWQQCDVGIKLDTNAVLHASPPWGQNTWLNNGIHILCNQAALPSFSEGLNQMNNADDALLLGTVEVSDSSGESGGAPHTIHWNHNMWPNATLGQAMTVPYLGLESTVDGSPVHAIDLNPMMQPCEDGAPEQEEAAVKKDTFGLLLDPTTTEWMLYPNPVDDLLHIQGPDSLAANDLGWGIYNLVGQTMESHAPHRLDARHWELSTRNWAPGIYLIECTSAEQSIFQRPFIVKH